MPPTFDRAVLNTLLAACAWPVASASIVGAFTADYWMAVRTFRALDVPVATSVDGAPMPVGSALDAILWGTLPLAVLGAAASAVGVLRFEGALRAPLGVLLLCNLALGVGRLWPTWGQ